MEKENKCRMCGKCCLALRLDIPYEYVKNKVENSPCAKHIVENCEHISREKALELNPELKERIEFDNKYYPDASYYTCKLLKDNVCAIHDKDKPYICSGFPFYKRDKYNRIDYSEDCGFNDIYRKEDRCSNCKHYNLDDNTCSVIITYKIEPSSCCLEYEKKVSDEELNEIIEISEELGLYD